MVNRLTVGQPEGAEFVPFAHARVLGVCHAWKIGVGSRPLGSQPKGAKDPRTLEVRIGVLRTLSRGWRALRSGRISAVVTRNLPEADLWGVIDIGECIGDYVLTNEFGSSWNCWSPHICR